MPKPRVAVAMSGGVDSSLACLLLAEQGFDVVGFTMKLLANPPSQDDSVTRPCCTLEMVEDAKRICHELGIPHYTINLAEEFEKEVIERFVDDYRRGKTPNPCLLCNSEFKFGHLLRRAKEIDAKFLATGHYARVGKISATGEFLDNHHLAAQQGVVEKGSFSSRTFLARGADRKKDQSYALYGLTQDMLEHAMFPLGGFSKQEVRRIAARKGLVTAEKPESQEICFVTQGDYRTFLMERSVPVTPGPIVDTSGAILGRHKGLAFYTVGQRKGLDVFAPYPLYVVDIDLKNNRLAVGKRSEAFSGGCLVQDVNYVMEEPSGAVRGTCMVRYRGEETGAVWTGDGIEMPEKANRARVEFDSPKFAVTPGQALVLYHDQFVFSGGTISKRL